MASPSSSENKELVNCYNCAVREYGWRDVRGCILCLAPYGNGQGKLFKEFRDKVLTVKGEDGKDVKFDPPSYSCTFCKDTKKFKYWIKYPMGDSMIGCGGRNFDRQEELTCRWCSLAQHEADMKEAGERCLKEGLF